MFVTIINIIILFVQGIKKHKLLEDVLSVVGGHLRWQRLYLEYTEQLTALKNQIN